MSMMTGICQHCGREYLHRSEHLGRSKFCSMSCRSQSTARRTAESRGDQQRHRGAGKSYVKRLGRHEHRVVAEKMIGRPLKHGEVVHHVDGNIRNNSPENLKIMSAHDHMRTHGIAIPGITPYWKPWGFRK